ncbi:hypothetical protein [Paraburkholderia dipogonis]
MSPLQQGQRTHLAIIFFHSANRTKLGKGAGAGTADFLARFRHSRATGHRVSTIENAMNIVDIAAKVNGDIGTKRTSVESRLMPEKFLVAFEDENYDVIIVEA